MMKRLLPFLAFVFSLVACSADFDTFGESDYNDFKDIRFEEQSMKSSVYPDEHIIKVTLDSVPDSLKTWDSVTIESVSMSHMASLHLVKSKFKEFPGDSAAIDSLSNALKYYDDELKKGSKVKLPSGLTLYVMVVSESGEPSLWQINFTIPNVVVPASSNSASGDSDDEGDEGDEGNSQTDNVKSSSSKAAPSSGTSDDKNDDPETPDNPDEPGEVASSSSIALNSNNDLQVTFKDELENVVKDDSIFVTFAQGTDLKKVELDTAIIHRKASVDNEPAKVKDWSKAQKFVVTAEDGSAKTWIVVVRAILSSETDLQVSFEKQLKISKSGDTIAVKLENGAEIASAKVQSFAVSDGAKVKPAPDSVTKWSEFQKFTVTAEDGSEKVWVVALSVAEADEKASSDKDLVSISAEGQTEKATVDADKKTVVLHLASAEARSSVKLSIEISETASHNFGDGAVNLLAEKTLTITAEDGSTVDWKISADYPVSADADVLTFETDDFSSVVNIDRAGHAISLEVGFGVTLDEVYFTATYSEGAKLVSPKLGFLNLEEGSAELVVAAANGETVTWSVTVSVSVPAPQIKSISIGNEAKAVGVIDEKAGTIFFNVDYSKDLNLRSLSVKQLTLSDGASTEDIKLGESYDFAVGKTVTVKNGNGDSKTYKLQAGYQYPGSDFNTWKKDIYGNMNAVNGWDNGNNDYAKELTTSEEGGTVVKMESQNAVVKFASGNMLIAKFNPLSIAAASMAGYDDGNELIDFGKPFYGRPKYVEFDVKYDGKGDSCDIYLILESRLTSDGKVRTENDGANRYRKSSDVNTLVASAWFRSKSVEDDSDPDVVSITDATRSGYKTIRMAIHYGVPLEGSPIYNSRTFSTEMEHPDKGIDNHLVKTDEPDNFPVTHIRVVMASSALGNLYKGEIGATLYVDEMRLIY